MYRANLFFYILKISNGNKNTFRYILSSFKQFFPDIKNLLTGYKSKLTTTKLSTNGSFLLPIFSTKNSMKKNSIMVVLILLFVQDSTAQSISPGYFTTIPASIKNCGAMYTYDTVGLQKKKYILLVDFQNEGMIKIAGKQINLLLYGTNTVDKMNVLTYKGSGYVVVLSSSVTNHIGDYDIEEGTLLIKKGTKKEFFKIHGKSGCDSSTQERNSK